MCILSSQWCGEIVLTQQMLECGVTRSASALHWWGSKIDLLKDVTAAAMLGVQH